MPLIDRKGREVTHVISPCVYLGIDPGASGGLAYWYRGVAHTFPMLDTERDIWDWFVDLPNIDAGCSEHVTLPRSSSDVFACIELVGGFIKGNPAPGSTMFNFGKGYGLLLMALTASGIPFECIRPQVWQKGLGITTRGKDESVQDHKRKLRRKAQQLFPDSSVTLKTCDALLIMEFCKRKREGTL